MVTYLFFAAGLVLLVIGADLLVKGASRIAAGFGISPLIIGLTVVAFGTSSPELAVSVQSALAGGVLSLSQRVSELRRGGVTVVDKWIETDGGARIKAYRILRGPMSWTA